jgi:AAA family ATPase
LDRLKHKVTDAELLEISQSCHGYVGADLQMLVQEAGLNCVKSSTKNPNEKNVSIAFSDLSLALRKVKPSAMREITFDIPKVEWSQIGGQHDLKKKLQQAIIWPIKYADSFKRLNIKPPRGLLMYGPPGCSKTMIAKALATETGLNFIAVKVEKIVLKYHFISTFKLFVY